jgi:hypothetical protein
MARKSARIGAFETGPPDAMKPALPTDPRIRRILTAGALLLSPWMAGSGRLWAADATPAKADDQPVDYNNWIDFSTGGVITSGDRAQFQHRYNLQRGPFGGIESFHWEKTINKKNLFQIDGRGIFDNHDYSLRLGLSNPDKGYVRAGYREFRTWSDGNGGFFPQTGQWLSLYDNVLALDRGEAWFEAGLTLPKVPLLTFRYSHQFRHGQEDSLEWGESTVGLSPLAYRNIVPSFRNIDEKSDTFQGDLKYRVAKTDFGVGLRYQIQDNRDSLNTRQFPGEAANDRNVTDVEGVRSDLFNAHAFTQTRISPKVLLTTGYSFTTLDSDLSGSRIYGATYDPVYDPTFARQQTGFLDLAGGGEMRQYVMNLNLMLTPWDYFSLVPAVRVEKQDLENQSDYQRTDPGFGATPATASSSQGLVDVSESLALRYTRLTNWVFYAQGDWTQEQNDLNQNAVGALGVLPLPPTTLTLDSHDDAYTQKYTVGANWYPLSRLNLSGQYYHKIHTVDYRYLADSTLGYPGFLTDQDFDLDDLNVRVTYRPINPLTLVTRYDFQLSGVNTAADSLGDLQTAEVTGHILSESLTWTPVARWYLQGTVNYVRQQTHTPGSDLTGAATDLVLDSRNDYWDASAMTGYALDNKTDLQAQYFFYRANDSVDNSVASLPYGADATQHGVTVTMTRRIRRNLRWTLKYGFFDYRDRTSGDHNDYQAHLVYTSMRYLF